jgi:uncharacterized protein YgbK (DUF1537 family)
MDNQLCIIVLDDDPTGIQTIHGCLVLTPGNVGNEDALQIVFQTL